MEWLILLIVVPLVLVPLVLLFGFAGCGLEAVGTAPVPGATNLTANATFVGNESQVILSWIATNGGTKFKVRRNDSAIADADGTTFTDSPKTGLKEGTTYRYEVEAVTVWEAIPGGVSNEVCVTVLPAAPSLANALPLTTNKIQLNWLGISEKGTLFRIERRDPGQTSFIYVNETGKLTFDDGVAEGGTYDYRVFTIVEDGCDESLPRTQVLSPPSNVVVGKPLAFATAFGAAPQPNLHNHCLVQRIRVTGTGSKITLIIGDSPTGLRLDSIWISRVGAGGNPWDADTQPTLIAQNVVLPAGGFARVLGPVDYVISTTPVDLLVAFDINATAGQGNVPFVNMPGAESYTLNYAANPNVPRQAGVQNRVPTFQTAAGRHYLVEKIQVS